MLYAENRATAAAASIQTWAAVIAIGGGRKGVLGWSAVGLKWPGHGLLRGVRESGGVYRFG